MAWKEDDSDWKRTLSLWSLGWLSYGLAGIIGQFSHLFLTDSLNEMISPGWFLATFLLIPTIILFASGANVHLNGKVGVQGRIQILIFSTLAVTFFFIIAAYGSQGSAYSRDEIPIHAALLSLMTGCLTLWPAFLYLISLFTRQQRIFALLGLAFLAWGLSKFQPIFAFGLGSYEFLSHQGLWEIIFQALIGVLMIVAPLEWMRDISQVNRRRLLNLMEMGGDAIFILKSANEEIVYLNRQAREILGEQNAVVIGKPFSAIGKILETSPKRDGGDSVRGAIGQFYSFLRQEDQEPTSIRFRRFDIPNEDGEDLHVLQIQDITDVVKQEIQLAERISQNNALQRVSHALTRTLNVKDLTRVIYDKMAELFELEFFAIDRYDHENRDLINLMTMRMSGGVMTRLEGEPPGAGMTDDGYKACLEDRQLHFIRNPWGKEVIESENSSKLFVIPLIASDQVVAIMYVKTVGDQYLPGQQIELLQNIADMAGIALRNAQFYETQSEQYRRQKFLAQLGPALRGLFEIETIGQFVGERLKEFLDADQVEVWLVVDDSERLKRIYPGAKNPAYQSLIPDHTPTSYDIMTAAFGSGLTIVENDTRQSRLIPVDWLRRRNLKSCLAAPIMIQEEQAGVLRIDDCRNYHRFSPQDIEFIKLVCQFMAVSMESARLYQTARRSEERFAHLLEEANVGIVILKDEKFDYANAHFQTLFQLEDTPIQQLNMYELIPDKYEEIWRRSLEAAMQGKGSSFESQMQRLDGRLLVCDISISPLQSQGLPQVQILVSDETDKKSLEKQRQDDMRFKSIGSLTASIGRDFQSLFSVMQAQLGYLRLEDNASEATSKSLDIMEIATHRAMEYTRQLLSFAQSSISGLRLLDLNSVIYGAGQLFDGLADKEHARLIFQLSSQLPMIRGQEEQLTQAFLNLLLTLSEAAGGGNSLYVRSRVDQTELLDVLPESLRDSGATIIVELEDANAKLTKSLVQSILNTQQDTSRKPALGMSVAISTLRSHQVTTEVVRVEGRTICQFFFPTEQNSLSTSLSHKDAKS